MRIFLSILIALFLASCDDPKVNPKGDVSDTSAFLAIGQTTLRTPTYQFNSKTAGLIRSSGSCSFAEKNITIGANSVTLNPLEPGKYSDCKIEIYSNNNLVDVIAVEAFEVIETQLSASSAIGSVSTVKPTFTFTSNASGIAKAKGSCTFPNFTVNAGTNTVTFDFLGPGTYLDCGIEIYQGNVLTASLDITSFTIFDRLILEYSTITDSTNYSPNYQFYSREVGEVRSSGSCHFTSFDSSIGVNTVTFNPLAPGTYSDCKLDFYQNNVLQESFTVSPFTILPFNPTGFVDTTIDGKAFKLCPHTLTTSDDPIALDSDGDGWGAECEAAAGTDPNNSDTDGDGFLDGADQHPLNPVLPVTPVSPVIPVCPVSPSAPIRAMFAPLENSKASGPIFTAVKLKLAPAALRPVSLK